MRYLIIIALIFLINLTSCQTLKKDDCEWVCPGEWSIYDCEYDCDSELWF